MILGDQLEVGRFQGAETSFKMFEVRIIDAFFHHAVICSFRSIKRDPSGKTAPMLEGNAGCKSIKKTFGVFAKVRIEGVRTAGDPIKRLINEIRGFDAAFISKIAQKAGAKALVFFTGLFPVLGKQVQQGIKLLLPNRKTLLHEELQATRFMNSTSGGYFARFWGYGYASSWFKMMHFQMGQGLSVTGAGFRTARPK